MCIDIRVTGVGKRFKINVGHVNYATCSLGVKAQFVTNIILYPSISTTNAKKSEKESQYRLII